MTLPRLALVVTLALAALAAPAGAASVAYIDGYNTWLSSPDGAQKYQLTSGGSEEAGWQVPAQGADGKTVVVHRDTFDGGSKRPVLYLYGPDGKLKTANVMPVYAGATIPVYPIGLDMDWNSNAVAYGYSYCGFACQSTYRGFWLTFSDNQGLYPSDPQGQSDAYNPTFFHTRVISSDSGGSIFVQPDVAEAPFTSSYQGWLSVQGLYLSRVAVAHTGRMLAIEWSRYDDASTKTGQGIVIGQHQGTIPSDVTELCDLPTAADPTRASFSPDGTQIAWADAEGVKVAGAPNLAAGTDTCTLTSPVKVISATGHSPSFGGADVGAILKSSQPQQAPGGDGSGPGSGQKPATLTVTLAGKATRTAFAKGLNLRVPAPAAGRVSASASVPRKVAARLRLGGASSSTVIAGASRVRGFAAATSVVVARGSAIAKAAGTVTIKLKPTKAAKRAAKRLRGVTLTIKVAQGPSTGATKVKLK